MWSGIRSANSADLKSLNIDESEKIAQRDYLVIH